MTSLPTSLPSAPPNCLPSALSYAARGWRVIPLHSMRGGDCSCGDAQCGTASAKHPRTKHGVSDASSDPETIKGWWARWPDANVGIATGPEFGGVIDVDPRKQGSDTLTSLQATYGALPATLTAATGGGGFHHVYAWPEGRRIPSKANALGPGVDTRGSGGYIVAAPSVHASGVAYRWEPSDEVPLAPFPSWVLDTVDPPAPTPIPRQSRPDVPLADRVKRASAYLAKIPGAVAGSGGHDQTWSAALAVVRGFELPHGVAVALLESEYNCRCDPPWSERELTHKIADACDRASVPWGYLLDVSPAVAAKRGAVPRSSRTGLPPSPAAAPSSDPDPSSPPDAYSEASALILAGRPLEEIVPVVARISTASKRDELVARVAHERHVSKVAVRSDVMEVRRARRTLRVVAPDDTTPDPNRPEILIEAGKLDTIADEAESALLASPGPPIYQRGRRLVRTLRAESLTIRRGTPRVRRAEGALIIHPIEPAYLVRRLTSAARWRKYDSRAQDWLPADAPPKVADVILASAGDWDAPALLGIVEAPTLRPDGSILETPGYDEQTGLLFDPGTTQFALVPENPTREDATKAATALLELLKGFPFVQPSDRSAALSAILTGLIRRSLRSAPLHAFRAPKMRSGKSLLADTTALFATGRPCAVLSQADPEEERKRLLAILLAGDPVVCLDNLSRPLGGDTLCQVLTQESIQDRILGVSEAVTVPTSVTLLATGNNLVIEGDLTSRVVPCDLDPQMEHPEEREFQVDLYREIPARRGELVAHALTILRAYHVAGRPHVGIPRWGGFDEWNAWVRASIVWVGLEDPAAGRTRIEESDPVRRTLRALLSVWFDVIGTRAVTSSELVRHGNVNSDLREALVEFAGEKNGEINTRNLGNRLRQNTKRIEGGFRLMTKGVSHQAILWEVENLNPGELGESGESVPVDAGWIDFQGITPGGRPPEVTPQTPQTPRRCPDCGSANMVPRGSSNRLVCPNCLGA